MAPRLGIISTASSDEMILRAAELTDAAMRRRSPAGAIELIEVGERDSYALELENFAAAALGGELLLPASDAVDQSRVIAALYESA